MKTYTKLFLICSLLFCGSTVAQTELAGTWQGKLVIDQNNKMTIQFILTKKADGSYAAVLNSPDTGGIKNVAASAVKYSGGKLSIDVASLNGSFSGTASKGTITGEWRQQGSTFPLVLTPYKKPESSSLKPLLGEWVGKLKVTDALSYNIVFRYEIDKDGRYVAFLDSPDQGAKGIPAADVLLEGKQVSFKIPAVQGEYTGQITDKNIAGTWKQPGFEGALAFTKGKFQAPPTQVDISADAMKQLLGRWLGKIGPLSLVFRFERNAEGKPEILIDSPDQKANGLPVAKASLTDGTLLLEVPAVGGKYSGKLSGNQIDGTWTQLGNSTPLSLTKEQAIAAPKK